MSKTELENLADGSKDINEDDGFNLRHLLYDEPEIKAL